jgi:hypothetical protein
MPAAFVPPPVLEPDPASVPGRPVEPQPGAAGPAEAAGPQVAMRPPDEHPAVPGHPIDRIGPGHEQFGNEHTSHGYSGQERHGRDVPGRGPERTRQEYGVAPAPHHPGEPGPPEIAPATSQRHRAEPPHGLPQRVPSEPDVPRIADPTTEPPAPAPALSRIASGLRRDDVPPSDRPDGFDVAAVLSAVRDVPGVRDAQLRATETGGHTLRLDLADGSDPAYVSRVVARMLNERMGLVAEPPPRGERPTAGGGAARSQAARLAGEPPARQAAVPPVPIQPSGPPYTEDRSFGAHGSVDRGPIPPGQPGAPPLPPGLIPASAAPREPRRRHPLTMRGRYPNELRPGVDRFGRPDEQPEPGRSPALTPPAEAARVILDHVQVSTFGLDATVEVRLVSGERVALGVANGPAVDGYVLRLCAAAAANAVDELLGEAADDAQGRGHCYVEQAAIIPMGSCEVAVVVVLLVCNGWVEQLAGSALVSGDPRQAVVRATLAAVNRRLTALLP